MKITRHNYEEFFLLYVDNELSSEDRRMVEKFVQLHPDLKDELDLLSQFRFTPDDEIVFENKEELLKTGGQSPLTINNYEELFLSYIDNELTAEQRTAVEQLVYAYPAAKKELEILQKTKLQPETFVFAHKESLYRKEEKVRSLPFRWWRAAAAILILALGLTTALILNNKSAVVDTVVKNKGTEKIIPADNKTTQPVKEAITGNNPYMETDDNNATTGNKDKQTVLPVNKQKKNQAVVVKENKSNNTINNQLPVKDEEAVLVDATKKPSNNLPTPVNNPNVIDNTPANRAIADINSTNAKNDIITNAVVTNPVTQPSDIRTASFNSSNETLVQSDGKKNKLRGLFRKAARTFEKRTDIDPTDNDNRLLVGGFAIRLK